MRRSVLALAICAGAASAQSPDVGNLRADAADLGRVFVTVCVQPTSLAQAHTVLRAMGMLDNPETGTFFHQIFDMSINPGDGTCSIVFVTDRGEDVAIAAFRASVTEMNGAPVPALEIGSRESGGELYMAARLEVPW